jgi:hypothetical protein
MTIPRGSRPGPLLNSRVVIVLVFLAVVAVAPLLLLPKLTGGDAAADPAWKTLSTFGHAVNEGDGSEAALNASTVVNRDGYWTTSPSGASSVSLPGTGGVCWTLRLDASQRAESLTRSPAAACEGVQGRPSPSPTTEIPVLDSAGSVSPSASSGPSPVR